MSGYIRLNRTGFGPFDDSLSLIEEAGDSYHHTSQWLDEGWNDEKPYIARINESIEFAANSYSDLIDALTALKTELREIRAAIDDHACDLTLTTVECIKKLKAENESLRKDAERYRWLKNNNSPIGIYSNADFDDCYYIHEPDETIDAAMSQGEQ